MPEIKVEDREIHEFDMRISKAITDKNGKMQWVSVNSDIKEDVYHEKMSIELFDDFIEHIENDEPIPEVFRAAICEEEWCGGMPYISVAHYKSGTGKVNVPGEVLSLYRDGKMLKSKGILYDTPLGKSVFKSLQTDLVEKRDDKVRISIGFVDLEHSHGDKFTFVRKAVGEKCPLCIQGIGDKIYKKGYLVHLALTRKPANPRTDMELELKSMTTKLEDAKSIVEDEEVLNSLELKSQVEEVLVVKMDDKDMDDKDCPEDDEECKKKRAKMHEEKSVSINVDQNGTLLPAVAQPVTPIVQASTTDPRGYKEVEPIAELTPLQKSVASIVERVNVLKSQGVTGEDALKQIQPVFDELGTVIKSELTPPPSPEQVANQNLESTLRSLLAEMLPQMLAQTVAPMQAEFKSEIGELRALSLTKPIQKENSTIPTPRSLNLNLQQKSAVEALVNKTKKSQIELIAEQSVGL